jgi:hypothetical protein
VSLRTTILIAALAALALIVPGAAVGTSPQLQNELVGTVGPGFTISVTRDGQPVTHLDPGTYTITVNDLSIEHNFHLTGPGVNQTTVVETESTVTWTVTFTDGTYRYLCDPHANIIRGSFTVGNVQPPPPPPPTPPAKRLTATVGPGAAISLKTAAGRKASRVAAGVYRITVRDRTNKHNFHLRGAGVNKLTRVPFKGTVTWSVRLQKGKAYRYYSDRNKRKRGTVRGI